jgi:hypothetical protein
MVLFPNPHVRFGLGIHDHSGSGQELAVKEDIAARLGWDDGEPIIRDWQPRRSVVGRHVGFPSESDEDVAKAQKAQERFKALWQATEPTGEPMLAYLLRERGLSAACYGDGISHALRFHPDLPFWIVDGGKPDGSYRYVIKFRSPAMISRIVDCVTGKTVGLQRTWLTPDGRKHPETEGKARKMIKGSGQGTVALSAPDESGLVGVTEGVESALALQELMGTPCHAALNADGLEKWTPPNGTRAVLIGHDDDANGRGLTAAEMLSKRLSSMGLQSRLYPPKAAHRAFVGCNDWNDALLGKRSEVPS